MVDVVQSVKDHKAHCKEIEVLQSLSRSMMTAKEMVEVDEKIKRHTECIKNIRVNLYAEQQKTRKR